MKNSQKIQNIIMSLQKNFEKKKKCAKVLIIAKKAYGKCLFISTCHKTEPN